MVAQAVSILFISLLFPLARGISGPSGTDILGRSFPTIIFGSSSPGDESLSSAEGNPDTSIVGILPLIPTLKMAMLAILSSLLLPGVHVILTLLSVAFAVVGITALASQFSAEYSADETESANLRTPLPFYPSPYVIQEAKQWTSAPGIMRALENASRRYKDA